MIPARSVGVACKRTSTATQAAAAAAAAVAAAGPTHPCHMFPLTVEAGGHVAEPFLAGAQRALQGQGPHVGRGEAPLLHHPPAGSGSRAAGARLRRPAVPRRPALPPHKVLCRLGHHVAKQAHHDAPRRLPPDFDVKVNLQRVEGRGARRRGGRGARRLAGRSGSAVRAWVEGAMAVHMTQWPGWLLARRLAFCVTAGSVCSSAARALEMMGGRRFKAGTSACANCPC